MREHVSFYRGFISYATLAPFVGLRMGGAMVVIYFRDDGSYNDIAFELTYV